MAAISISSTGGGFTAVSNVFIDNYMPEANPAYSVVYLYLIRNIDRQIDIKEIASAFSLLESDVLNAMKYWEELKLLKIRETGDELAVTLLSAKGSKKQAPKAGISPEISFSQPPQYTPEELEMYKNSYSEISSLFDYCEKTLGKLLKASDLSILYSFYDWLRLPIDVIEYLLEYCAEKGHRRMKYIEAVAIDWAENGIKDVDMAKEYVNVFNKDYRQIMNAMGLSGRNPAPKEIQFMDKWMDEYSMPLDIILEACDKTIMTLGKPQFSYTNSIIERWFTSGVKTLDDVKKAEAEFKDSKAPDGGKASLKEPQAKKNKFINYEQDKRNYDEFEKLESEFLLKKLKGKGNE